MPSSAFHVTIAAKLGRLCVKRQHHGVYNLVTSVVLSCLALPSLRTLATTQKINFGRDILPLLSDRCFHCHGPDANAREAGLRLDLEEAAKAVSDGVAAIVPGNSAASLIVQRMKSHDPVELMPPPRLGRPMHDAEIAKIIQWIDEGAPWGTHWALEPVSRPEPPPYAKHPIDAFVNQRLVAENLLPNPAASKHTLIRRASLDLTGLPPTPAEVRSFLDDTRPDAWTRVIDRLLASPAFGERMAWDWLDAARYADSNGYQHDAERTMWPWRDWVVQAFNQNLPWDEFTRLQLAGDLLPDATDAQRLPTGFLRNHPINGEGGRIPEENRVDYTMDMTETVGTVWLGLTFNCCRCHDHKYDALSQKDYFSFFAFFNQTPVTGEDRSPSSAPNVRVRPTTHTDQPDPLDSQLAEARDQLKVHETRIREQQATWEAAQLSTHSPTAPPWEILTPHSISSDAQLLTLQPDASVLASDDNPANDTYTFTATNRIARVHRLRLEALRHPSMTEGRLARSNSGNFVLTEIEVAAHLADGTTLTPRIARALASYEQKSYPVANAFDGNPKTGWAVYNGSTVVGDHQAVFVFDPPIENTQDAVLTITLRHTSPHVHHNIGRFRLAVSSGGELSLEDGTASPLFAALRVAPDARDKAQRALITEAHRQSDTEVVRLAKHVKELEGKVRSRDEKLPVVMVMEDMKKMRPTYTLDRGVYNAHRDEVFANVPAALPPLPPGAPANRLGLSNWLMDRGNPLTARVTVNRLWQMLFGIGLVKTPEDFGVQAEVPPHPELLDWLAAEFMESGWDVKALLRTIMTSEMYQRDSRLQPDHLERDPANRLFARGARFRLPAWMLRDQALGVSGLLDPKVGGRPVHPYQPEGVWEEASFGEKKYPKSTPADVRRRSIYTFWRRIIAPTMFFDNAARQVCSVKPFLTNTPMHALTTLNDITFVEAARVMAERVLLEPSTSTDEASRISALVSGVLARQPTAAESAIWQTSLTRARESFQADPASADALLAHGLAPRNPTISPQEHAAFTVLALSILNTDEALSRE